jgi:hypothetical protein
MSRKRLNVEPMERAKRSLRQRLSLREELMLATAPTLTVFECLGICRSVESATAIICLSRLQCFFGLP